MISEEEPCLYLSGRFEDVEFVGNDQMVLGVPFDAPDEFKNKVWAAAQCFVFGNSSMDYFYKRYCADTNFPRPDKNRRRLSSILRRCSFEIERISGELTNGVDRETTLGLFASESALMRLTNTFRYAAFLLMQGATFESAAMLRLCLEQIAWSFEVHGLDDRSLFAKNPTRSVSYLKRVYPSCGRLYSLLSDYTHINPKLQRGYLDFSGEYAAVVHRNFESALQMSDLYVKLVDLYVRVAERISHKYFKTLQAWHTNTDGELIPNEEYSCTTVPPFGGAASGA